MVVGTVIGAPPDISPPDPLASAQEQRRQRARRACLRVLHAPGGEQRLAPLAQHMGRRHLVRARNEDGAPLRRLDLEVLRAALSTLLRDDDDDGYVVYQLVVADADPAQVARERDVSQGELLDLLREAVDTAPRCSGTSPRATCVSSGAKSSPTIAGNSCPGRSTAPALRSMAGWSECPCTAPHPVA